MRAHPTNSLAQDTVDLLLDKIIGSREFPLGSTLPSERDLATQLNVSRPTVREAINVLDALGIVEVRHGSGVRVTKEQSPLSTKLLKQMVEYDSSLILELIEARMDFESLNAWHAAKEATDADIERLGEVLEEMRADLQAKRPGFDTDMNFHLTVAKATRNRVRLFITTSMFLDLANVLEESRKGLMREPKNAAELLQHHREIYIAIRDRDSAGAAKAMRKHLDAAYNMNVTMKRGKKQ
jgi:GntR family transcriptional regulator, transcriptional repressor for pyruvate dehydrogenase complex